MTLTRTAYEAIGRLLEDDDDNICDADLYNIAIFCRFYLDKLIEFDDLIEEETTDEELRKSTIVKSELARYGEACESNDTKKTNN